MRNASGHQCKEKMSGSDKKSEREHVRHFLHKKVSGSFTWRSCKTTAKKCTKKVCCTCKVAFLLIRPIVVFHRSPALPSPLSITRFYIFFEQTITNIIESSASYISVVHCRCSFYFGDYDDNSMAPIWRDATGLCIGTVYFLLQSAL